MDLELRHMELVCRIHEAGSLSKAERLLGVSQPSLTAALHRIEKAAGGRLFDRSRQGISPTDLGQFLLIRARPLIHEVRQLTTAVRQRAESDGSPAPARDRQIGRGRPRLRPSGFAETAARCQSPR